MKEKLRQRLIEEAKKRISAKDPSHDFGHALRVLASAELIAGEVGGDLDIVISAALFHDCVVHPKDSPQARFSADESAAVARKVLRGIVCFPKQKIPLVSCAIIEHSFSGGLDQRFLESKIIWDADKLECSGALAIMRTFCSTGQMRRGFFDLDDPFCDRREPDRSKFALDFVLQRLVHAQEMMHFDVSRKLCAGRARFLHAFLDQLRSELSINGKEKIVSPDYSFRSASLSKVFQKPSKT